MTTAIDPPTIMPEGEWMPASNPVLHCGILRRIAETANGMRYRDTYFEVLVNEATGEQLVNVSYEPPADPRAWVLKCTAWPEPDVPPVTRAIIASGDTTIDLMDVTVPEEELQGWTGPLAMEADAVFWSASAVEKFLVPYYASTFGCHSAEIVAQLVNVFIPSGSPERDAHPMMNLGMAHDAPAGELPSTTGTPAALVETPADYDQPFAVVHLPSSEYAAEGPGAPATPLFTLHKSGTARRIRVGKAQPPAPSDRTIGSRSM